MKKLIILVVFSICAFAILSLLKVTVSSVSPVIYIKGGQPILADHVSQSDQFVYYDKDGKSGMFMKDDVSSVGTVQVKKKISLLTILDREKQRIMSALGFNAKLIRAVDIRLLIFFVIFGFSAATMWLVLKLAAVKRSRAPSSDRLTSTPVTGTNGEIAAEGRETSELHDIAMFFLELYKLQNGLSKDAAARFSMTAASAGQKMKVFELGVKGASDWLSRRMSIGPLGEDTGSKSKCFYVIYDTHMVVKIPPVPVTDMVKYVRDIRREVQIAAQLSPVACIVPMVSVVLKKVKKLPFESSLTQEQLEKQYIRLVEENTVYQEYLKVGDRFAFFMELSNSFFLGRVIDELHRSKENIGDEINGAPDAAWNQEAFTARYGLDALPVFEGLQTLYQRCEAEARRIIGESGQGDRIHTFQIKNWFLTSISGEKLEPQGNGVDADMLSRIEDGFGNVFKKDKKSVDSLVQLLRKQLERKAFLKSRQQIENIASNMLRLLCQLKEKHIALRDLKPDNLFLDADPDNYPVFLNNPTSFSIGVIDVETACSLIPNREGSIDQPILGGTPLYATPLHLFKNPTISAYFGDLAEALHLEDWFATLAIIFKAVAGRSLFPRAARSFPGILKILKAGRSKSDPSEETVKAMSRQFWAAAAADIKAFLPMYADVLNQLTLRVPEAMAPSIKSELERETECLRRVIQQQVSLSPLLKSEKNRNFLLEASCDTIVRQVTRWENDTPLAKEHRAAAPRMVAFLKQLNRLKAGEAEKRRALAAFDSPPHEVSAYALLEAMFQIVFRAMYKTRWKAAVKTPPATEEVPTSQEEDRAVVTTILNEN